MLLRLNAYLINRLYILKLNNNKLNKVIICYITKMILAHTDNDT